MKSQLMAAVIGATMLTAAPMLSPSASAQPAPMGSSGGYVVPVVVGAVAGAAVGAFLWPVIVPAATVPGAVAAAPEWGWGAFVTTRAAVGAIIGAGLGYISAR